MLSKYELLRLWNVGYGDTAVGVVVEENLFSFFPHLLRILHKKAQSRGSHLQPVPLARNVGTFGTHLDRQHLNRFRTINLHITPESGNQILRWYLDVPVTRWSKMLENKINPAASSGTSKIARTAHKHQKVQQRTMS